jgi:CubicO group peptidase (beta-lactamase class C family)
LYIALRAIIGTVASPFLPWKTASRVASVSKATGTLPGVMLAYDKGLFSLDDFASKHIPGLRETDKDSITIQQLLYHESGMPASLNMFNLMMDSTTYEGKLITRRKDAEHTIKIENRAYGHKDAKLRKDITSYTHSEKFNIEASKGLYVSQETFDTIMANIYNAKLRPTNKYNYSCLNFCLLMDMEQRVTGVPHNDWVEKNIYAPLGAYHTMYRPLSKWGLSVVAPTENDTYLRRQTVHGYVHDETANFSGGVQGNAGLFSNANDLAKLCQMWLNGGKYGGQQILSPETVKLFTTSKSPTCRRGLGFDKPDMSNPDNSPTTELATASTFGHLGFTGTVFWVDPENELIFIFLCNRVVPTRNNKAFSELNIRPALFEMVYQEMNK